MKGISLAIWELIAYVLQLQTKLFRHLSQMYTYETVALLLFTFPHHYPLSMSLCALMVRCKRYFPKSKSLWQHWEGGVSGGMSGLGVLFFASRFEESGFDLSLPQWVLFVIVGGESGTVRVKCIEHSTVSSHLSDLDCSETSALTMRPLYLPHRGFSLNCVLAP